MKKALLLLLFYFLPVALFPKEVEITFWHSLGFHVKEIIEEMADEYSANHPGIKVNPVFQGLFEDMQVKMLAAAVTHDLPDVAQIQLEYMEQYIENGLIEPINDIIPEEQRSDILESMWALVARDGRIYGVPFCISVTIFFYNENAFVNAGIDPDQPPATWEEMIRIGKRLTEDTDGDGVIDKYAILFWMDGFYGLAPFLWANGGRFFSEDGKRIELTSREMVTTIFMLRDLAFTHKIMPHNWTDWEGGQAFLAGNLAMGPFTSAAIYYGEQNLPWKLRVIQIPLIDGKRYSVLGGSALVNFSNNRKKRETVNDFIFWLVNKKNTIKIHEKVGYVPVRRSALSSLELRAFNRKNPNYKVPIDGLKYSRPLPNHPEFLKVNEKLREMLQRIFLEESDPVLELKKTEEEINAMLE